MARTENAPAVRGTGTLRPARQEKNGQTEKGRRRTSTVPAVAAAGQALLPSATHQGRRKRQRARIVRRFGFVLSRLPKLILRRPLGRAWAGVRGTSWRTGVVIGLALVILLGGAVGYVHTAPQWFVYRETVQINGVTYLNPDELYAASEVDSWNVFWLRPAEIRQRLLALPFVKEATVTVTLPNQVAIRVVEEEPVALWVTNDGTLWLMADGAALPMHDERFSTLPQLVDPNREAQDVTRPEQPAIDPSVLTGALALWDGGREIPQLRFNRDYGLNFNLTGSSTWVYWGDGRNLEKKFNHLAAVEQLIEQGEATPQIVDVRFDRPYIH
jgi:hypothetical protein